MTQAWTGETKSEENRFSVFPAKSQGFIKSHDYDTVVGKKLNPYILL